MRLMDKQLKERLWTFIKANRYWLSLVVLAMPPLLWWLQSRQIVHLADFYFPLDPSLAWQKSKLLWDPYEHNGTDMGIGLDVPKLFLFSLATLLQKLGLTITMILRLYFFTSLLMPALAMYFLVRQLFKTEPIIAFLAGAFMIYNPYMVNMTIDTPIILSMTLVPAALGLLLRSIRYGRPITHGLLLALISFIFTCYNPSSYSMALVVLVIVGLVIIGWQLRSGTKESRRSMLITLVIGILGGALVNAWLVFAYYIGSTGTGVLLSGAGSRFDLDFVKFASSYASPFNITRLIGAIAFFEGSGSEPYLPFAPFYIKSPLIILATLLLPTLVLFSLVVYKKRFVRGLGVGIGLSLLLAMGMHKPMTTIFAWLYTHAPLFWMWRSAWWKFSLPVTLGYAILISLAIFYFYRLLENRYRPWLIGGALAFFLVIGYPVFFGYVIWPKSATKTLPASRIDLPDYVYKTQDWINSQPKNGGVAPVQQLLLESTFYKWGYAAIRPFWADMFQDRGVVYNMYNTNVPTYPLIDQVRKHFRDPNFPADKIFDMLRLEYLVHQNDFRYSFFDPDAEKRQLALVDQQVLERLPLESGPTFGEWHIFHNSAIWPELFITDGLYVLDDLGAIPQLPDQPSAFTTKDKELPSQLVRPLTSPQISQALTPTAKQPTRLTILIEPAATDRLVIFNQSYSHYWQASLNNQPLAHYWLNSYANGFLVPANQSGELVIDYAPELWFDRLKLVMLTSLAILVIALLAAIRWERSRKEYQWNEGEVLS